jgi:hypothetical protein
MSVLAIKGYQIWRVSVVSMKWHLSTCGMQKCNSRDVARSFGAWNGDGRCWRYGWYGNGIRSDSFKSGLGGWLIG